MEKECEWNFAAFCEKHQHIINAKMTALESISKQIELLEQLNYFGDTGVRCSDDFPETYFAKWKNEIECDEKFELFEHVNHLLPHIPFEMAFRYKNPDFENASDSDILHEAFGKNVEWKHDPSIVKNLTREERQIIYAHFEYMMYYVINAKQELAYDIETS